MFEKFRENKYFDNILKFMRPVTIGMIGAAALLLITPYNFIDIYSYILFIAAFLIIMIFDTNPIYIILGSGVLGYLIYGL